MGTATSPQGSCQGDVRFPAWTGCRLDPQLIVIPLLLAATLLAMAGGQLPPERQASLVPLFVAGCLALFGLFTALQVAPLVRQQREWRTLGEPVAARGREPGTDPAAHAAEVAGVRTAYLAERCVLDFLAHRDEVDCRAFIAALRSGKRGRLDWFSEMLDGCEGTLPGGGS